MCSLNGKSSRSKCDDSMSFFAWKTLSTITIQLDRFNSIRLKCDYVMSLLCGEGGKAVQAPTLLHLLDSHGS